MLTDRFKQLQDIFAAALECDVGSRAEYVAIACKGDPAMAEEVSALLKLDAPGDTERPFVLALTAMDAIEAKTMLGRTVGRFR